MTSIAVDPCRERHARAAPQLTACPDRARPWVVLVAVLGSSLAFIDGTVVVVALPAMRAGLGASLTEMQWVVNAYTLTLAAFMLLGGAAGDAYGRKRVFTIGVIVFGLASLWCGLADSAGMLIAARAVQGIGGALLVPGSLALISAHFPAEERGRAIGTWAAATGIAAAAGPILGGWLIDVGPWHTIFLINVPVAAGTAALSWWRVPEALPVAAPRMDWRGGALAIMALATSAYGLTAVGGTRAAGGRGAGIAAMLAGAVLLAAFIAHEARARAPMMPLDLFRERAFMGANALTLLLYFALSGAMLFLPTALVEAHGWSAARAGSVFLPFTVMVAVARRRRPRRPDRRPPAADRRLPDHRRELRALGARGGQRELLGLHRSGHAADGARHGDRRRPALDRDLERRRRRPVGCRVGDQQRRLACRRPARGRRPRRQPATRSPAPSGVPDSAPRCRCRPGSTKRGGRTLSR